MLTVGSLFAGIGGWDLGLERAGMRVLWQCEVDPFAQRVLAKHWPDVLRVPDIRYVRADTVPAVDVLCGGFPCQDLSLAGKGAGLAGERSGLWSEYARVVGELRPRYVLVENVPALLDRGIDVVLGDLAALGYDAEWDCLPACSFGAPHPRDRLWLVAYPARPDGEARHRLGQGAARRTPQPDRGVASGRVVELGTACHPWTEGEPDVGRLVHGIPAGLARAQLHALGNALVPQIAEWLGRRIVAYEQQREELAA